MGVIQSRVAATTADQRLRSVHHGRLRTVEHAIASQRMRMPAAVRCSCAELDLEAKRFGATIQRGCPDAAVEQQGALV